MYYLANDSFLVAFHVRYRGSGTLNTHSRVILNRFATIIINHCISFRCCVSGVMGVWWWKVFLCPFFCHFAVGGWIGIDWAKVAKVEATRAKCFFATCTMTHFLWFRERRHELSFPGMFWVIIFSMHSCKSLFLPKHGKIHDKCQFQRKNSYNHSTNLILWVWFSKESVGMRSWSLRIPVKNSPELLRFILRGSLINSLSTVDEGWRHNNVNLRMVLQEKSITSGVYPLGTVHVCTKWHGSLLSSCCDLSARPEHVSGVVQWEFPLLLHRAVHFPRSPAQSRSRPLCSLLLCAPLRFQPAPLKSHPK